VVGDGRLGRPDTENREIGVAQGGVHDPMGPKSPPRRSQRTHSSVEVGSCRGSEGVQEGGDG